MTVIEPQTIRDVWYMMETSTCYHLYYKNLCSFKDMEEGCHTDRYTNVETDWDFNTIRVVTYESQCVHIDRERRSYSTQSLLIASETFHTIEEFKDSVYWDDFLSRFSYGNPDSSWFDDVEVNQDMADGVVSIKCEIGVPRYDSLNSNYRIARTHEPFYLCLDNKYGTISIDTKDNEYYFTVKELTDMIDTLKLLKDNNITVDKYSGIKIPWAEKMGDSE